MTIQLFDKDECPFCWRLRMALTLLQLDWQRNDYEDAEHRQTWQQLTPFATVPVLCIDDLVLTDSAVAIEYLNERHPGIIWPLDIKDRAHARSIARYADDKLGAAVRDVVFEKRGREEADWDHQTIDEAAKRFKDSVSMLESLLDESPGQTDSLSMLDLVMVTRLGLGAAYGLELDRHTGLQPWFERTFSNPVVSQTAPQVVKERLFKPLCR